MSMPFLYKVAIWGTEYGNILPNHIFDWKMQGVNCASEDYTLGNTSDISFTFETDIEVGVGATVGVNTFGFGDFLFQAVDVVRKKTLQNRYSVTCTSAHPFGENSVSLDAVIEKSDLNRLPANYTLLDLAEFASRMTESFEDTANVFVNASYVPSNTWWYQGLTYRQLLQWCYQLMGVNSEGTLWPEVWNTEESSFNGFFFPTTPNNCCIKFNANDVKSLDMANYKTPVIDKIWFGNESTDVGFSLGSGEQTMVFPSNPLINPNDTSFLNPLFTRVNALQSYTPMKIETFFDISTAQDMFPRPLNGYILNDKPLSKRALEILGGEHTYAHWIYKYIWFGLEQYKNPELLWDKPNNDNVFTDSYLPPAKEDYGDYADPGSTVYDSSRETNPSMYSINNLRNYIEHCENGCRVVLCRAEDLTVYGPQDVTQRGTQNYWLNDDIDNQFIVLNHDSNGFTVTKTAGLFNDDSIVKYWTWSEFVNYYNNTTLTGYHSGIYNYIFQIYFPRAAGKFINRGNHYTIEDVVESEDLKPDNYYWSGQGFPYYTLTTLEEETDFYLFPGEFEYATVNKFITLPAGTQIYTYSRDDAPGLYSEPKLLIPEYSNWRIAVFTDKVQGIFYHRYFLYYKPANADGGYSFSLENFVYNVISDSEVFTWMSYTDEEDITYYCPIFNWEATPSGIILEGTGNKDRRVENSYMSYDLRTTGKYVDINNSISGTETEISGVTSTISTLNVRVGNVEASLNNKVDSNDYNGNTIIGKINANGVTQTINASRVDLSDYMQESSFTGTNIIDAINSTSTVGLIDADRVDLSGLTTTYDGTNIITAINDSTTVGIIDANKVDLSGYTPPSYTGDSLINSINANGVTSTIDTDRLDLTGYVQSSSLATVATSGSYNDLVDKPTIPLAQVQSDWNQSITTSVDFIKNKPSLATVATSGSYNDLIDTPVITDISGSTTVVTTDTGESIVPAYALSFTIPANKRFWVEITAHSLNVADGLSLSAIGLVDNNTVAAPASIIKAKSCNVWLNSRQPPERDSMSYIGKTSSTATTYYIWVSYDDYYAGSIDVNYIGWYM